MATLHPASPSASSWLSQQHDLVARLDREPSNSQAWYWRIRVKLLSFLLARYGSNPNLSFTAARPGSPQFPIQKQDAKPMRAQTEIRSMLDRIAIANIDRWIGDD
jgi:hypothetical protein